MRAWLDKNLSLSKRLLCIEVILGADDNIVYNLLVVSIRKKGLEIARMIEGINPIQIKTQFGTDHPVVLVVSGRGVVVKALGENLEKLPALSDVFPAANLDDYLFQHSEIDNKNFVSIVKRETFDQLFSLINSCEFRIAKCFVGPMLVLAMRSQFESVGESLFSSVYEFRNDAEQPILNRSELSNEFIYKGIAYPNTYLAPLSGALCVVYDPKGFDPPYHLGLIKQISEEQQKQKFETIAKIGVSVLLFLVIVNRYLEYDFSRKFAELEVLQSLKSNEAQQIERTRKDLRVKKELSKILGNSRANFISYYGDQIASLIPSDIALTEMDLFSPSDKLEEENVLITLKGLSSEESSISQLVHDLETLKWTKSAIVKEVKVDQTQIAFSIRILLEEYE